MGCSPAGNIPVRKVDQAPLLINRSQWHCSLSLTDAHHHVGQITLKRRRNLVLRSMFYPVALATVKITSQKGVDCLRDVQRADLMHVTVTMLVAACQRNAIVYAR